MINTLKRMIEERVRKNVKSFWRDISLPGEFAHVVFDVIDEKDRGCFGNILEFGSSRGGNLKYFMDKMPHVKTVGVDINEAVKELSGVYPNYKGIIGDEKSLSSFKDKEFDFAFTVSVLDHIPFESTVEEIVKEMLRISKRVLFLEPYIEGGYGDVSGKNRNQVIKGFEVRNKKFAKYSYIWNYDAMLKRIGVDWSKVHAPLHAASLGPFYYLYCIPGKILKDRQKEAK